MITYEVKLKKIGEMTTLPDSQRLFGFLINSSKKYCSEGEISTFVKKVREQEEKCMISSVFPTGYYPTPKGFIMQKLEYSLEKNQQEIKKLEEKYESIVKKVQKLEDKKESNEDPTVKKVQKLEDKKESNEDTTNLKSQLKKIKNDFNNLSANINNLSVKNIYETIKNMDFIEKSQLNDLLKIREKIDVKSLKKFEYIKRNQTFIQKFRLENQIKELPGIPNVAYSLPILSFTNKVGEVQKEFSFFVKVEKESCISKCLERMKKNLDKHEIPCFLGGKGSSGYNEYQIHCIEKLNESEDKEHYAMSNANYLNMGVLLPDFDRIDAKNSMMDIHTSDRKPFEIENEIPKIISFVTEGSVIKTKEDKIDIYKVGKSIDNSKYNPLYRKNAIIFGNSYLVKLEV
ncbi:MAG: hypothetical protein ACTTKU_04705 [Eggerthia catenaformis]|uniref:hypothetical protein n=1 Tax=Eggerthia catenaformis TaxID=31973 RepID=UPI00047E4F37|nr:hypothetical protein [Eggerthia catenaformis]